MRAIFAHDNRFIPAPDGAVYSEGHFPASAWDRYHCAFDQLTVVARQHDYRPGKSIDRLNISSAPGVSFVFVPGLSSPAAQLLQRRTVVTIIRRVVEQGDAVIARLPSETGLLAVRVAESLGKPWAVELVECPWDGLWNYGTWQGKAYAPIMTWRTQRAVARAPFVLYVTERFLQSRYPSHVGEVIAASNVEIDTPADAIMARRFHRLYSPPNRLVFGLVGSLRGRFKGIQTVLAALALIKDRLPAFEFRVLGGGDKGPWEKLIRQYNIDGAVHLQGTLPSGEPVLSWLDDVDIYLQPSLKEGLPRALIEAMSRGCPALGSKVAGIPELLPSEVLHRPGDAKQLGALMMHMVSSQDWRAAQAKRNFDVAKGYAKEILEPRRRAFWQRFAVAAASQKGSHSGAMRNAIAS